MGIQTALSSPQDPLGRWYCARIQTARGSSGRSGNRVQKQCNPWKQKELCLCVWTQQSTQETCSLLLLCLVCPKEPYCSWWGYRLWTMQRHLTLSSASLTWPFLLESFAGLGSDLWRLLFSSWEWGPYRAGTTVGSPPLNAQTSALEK